MPFGSLDALMKCFTILGLPRYGVVPIFSVALHLSAGLLSFVVPDPGLGSAAVIIFIKVGRNASRCVEANIDRRWTYPRVKIQ
jgi:hypothetical protein